MLENYPATIHPMAVIEEGAQIGENVIIEPYAIVKKNVVLEDNVVIKSHVYLDGYTTIGEGTVIWPFSSIGTKPQDLKYKGEKTFVKIGKRCDIREYVTINSSCVEGTTVEIGDDCLLMAYCHVAHNCKVGKRVILANGVTLGGHVEVEDFAIVGGVTPIHQFCRIGKYAMVGGFSAIRLDVPPFTLGAGSPYRLGGLNRIGLMRNQFSLEERRLLAKVFKLCYRSNLSLDQALEKIEKELPMTENVLHWINFCKSSKRGLIGLASELREELVEMPDE